MDTHTTREVAKELVVFGLFTSDSDFERCIGISFHNDPDKFNYILRHR